MATQENLNKHMVKTITGWANTARVLWLKACEFDGIAPESKFVVFSEGNKYAKFYNQAMTQLFEARQQFADGGYVGLTVSGARQGK